MSTHLDHVETEFSFRTRILDYLWAGLSGRQHGGDALADMIESAGAGITVPPDDVDALEAALFDAPRRRGRRSAYTTASTSSRQS